jgi:hypothetical protein
MHYCINRFPRPTCKRPQAPHLLIDLGDDAAECGRIALHMSAKIALGARRGFKGKPTGHTARLGKAPRRARKPVRHEAVLLTDMALA